MTTRSMFPMDECEISRPDRIVNEADFTFWFSSLPEDDKPRDNSRFQDALACLKDHRAVGKFAAILTWPDNAWSVIFDSERWRDEILPGVIQDAYYGSRRGLYFKPCEGRLRATWSGCNEIL